MSEDNSFLPHFITDDIYLIPGKKEINTQSIEKVAAVPEKEETSSATHIVQTSIETPEVREPEPVTLKPIQTHGENLKHCIVMFSAENKLDTNSKDLLFKILAAIDRKPKDVLMANVYGCSNESIEALINENNHRHLISFGVQQPDLLSNAEVYSPISNKGKQYLLSDHLEEVAVDTNKKRALWGALQTIFS